MSGDAAGARGGGKRLERAHQILDDRNSGALRALADDLRTPDDVLYFLAGAPLSEIRARVAANPSASTKTDMMLADDMKPGVRAALAGKLGSLDLTVDGASPDGDLEIRHGLIEKLSRDEKPRVRRALSRALAGSLSAPRDLLARLALDHDAGVFGPVVRRSTVLSTPDLAALMKQRQDRPFQNEIASREDLDEMLCARLVATGDEATLTVLINNHSAALSDDMINHLASRAVEIKSWRGALARRPGVSARLLRNLAAGRALMAADGDAGHDPAARADLPGITDPLEPYEAVFSGLERHLGERLAEGTLTEATIAETASLGQHANIWVTLSLLTGASVAVVHRIMTTKAPRTIMALAWQAGLSAQTAVVLQRATAGIAPDQCTQLRQDGAYPLAASLMRWLLAPYHVGDGSDIVEGAGPVEHRHRLAS